MRAGQCESRVVVVKGRTGPRGCAVTVLAGLREAGLHVIGIAGALEIFQVTRNASGICNAVVIVDVTLRTL